MTTTDMRPKSVERIATPETLYFYGNRNKYEKYKNGS